MPLPIEQSALIECSPSNDYFFTGCLEGDVLFYPTNSNQRIQIGGGMFRKPTLSIHNKNVGINVLTPEYNLHVAGNACVENGSLTFTAAFNNDKTALTFVTNLGNTAGSIVYGTNGTSYNTLSDYRFKNVHGKAERSVEAIEKIPVYNLEYKDSDSPVHVGCLAHEIQDVASWAVTGKKDGDQSQTVDYSKLVPLLIASVQELSKRVAMLEIKN